MKKIFIALMIFILVGCSPKVQETPFTQIEQLSFNGTTYQFSDVSRLGYDLFNGDGHLLEIKCDTECIMSFELDDDIYIISGTSNQYEVSQNGSTVLIDGKDAVATGTFLPEWNDDIIPIFEAYEQN
jgi:hypothetical protein